MLRTAQEVISSGDDLSIVDYAVETNRLVSIARTELDAVKVHLRKMADGRRSSSEYSVEIEGRIGIATVEFPLRPEVTVRRGRNLQDLEVNLPLEVFRRLFVRTVQFRPVDDIDERIRELPADQREIVEEFVEITTKTPKVYLTK